MQRQLFLIYFLVFNLLGFAALAQQDAVELYGSSTTGIKGDIVKVEIRVNTFADILSFQASLNWNPNLLKYVTIGDFGIKDFSANNFGVSTTNLGHLRFLWEPTDASAVSAIDSTVLFSASFEVLSNEPQDVPINFDDITSSPPFKVEFANKDFEIVSVESYDAQVTILPDPVDQVNILTSPNTSCDEKVMNGSLSATVMGSSANHNFHWFGGNEVKENPDFVGNPYMNLAAGEYTLRVLNLDGSIFVDKVGTAIADAPAGIPDNITVIQNVAQSSCSENPLQSTGLIEITVNDAQPLNTYDISWWKGSFNNGEEMTIHQDLFEANQLEAGLYEVKVVNRSSNCASYQQQIVEEELVQFSIQLSMTENNFCADGANGALFAEVPNATQLDLSYFWFDEGEAIDTALALEKGQYYTNILQGNYRSWVIDMNSECASSKAIEVQYEPIYFETTIEQRNDTLFANSESANWYQEGMSLQVQAAYLIPPSTGNYRFKITNEFNCQSASEEIYFGVTSLLEPAIENKIYPNPFDEIIRVSNPNQSIKSIDIFDTRGAIVGQIENVKHKFIEVNLSGSADGIYYIKINESSGSITRKVVKNQF